MGTPTTNFAFTKPTVGGDADVWGTSTNANWDALDVTLGYLASGFLYGLTLSNNGSDATNDIDIAAGVAIDGTNARMLRRTSSITKQLDAAWAVGTNQGGLDTGSIANTTYHVWLIMRSDTGVVDVLFSTSASSPTMPANYDYKRRIGSIIRASDAIIAFSQLGDEFIRKASVLDISANAPGTSAVTRTLSVPVGIQVQAIVNFNLLNGSTGAVSHAYLSELDKNDEASSTTAAPLATTPLAISAAAGVQSSMGNLRIRTNTSAQIRSRVGSLGDANVTLYIATLGWVDTRGRLA